MLLNNSLFNTNIFVFPSVPRLVSETVHLIPDLSLEAQNNVIQSSASDLQLSANRSFGFSRKRLFA